MDLGLYDGYGVIVEKECFYGIYQEIDAEGEQEVPQELRDFTGALGVKEVFHFIGDQDDQEKVDRGPGGDHQEEPDFKIKCQGDKDAVLPEKLEADHPWYNAQRVD